MFFDCILKRAEDQDSPKLEHFTQYVLWFTSRESVYDLFISQGDDERLSPLKRQEIHQNRFQSHGIRVLLIRNIQLQLFRHNGLHKWFNFIRQFTYDITYQ